MGLCDKMKINNLVIILLISILLFQIVLAEQNYENMELIEGEGGVFSYTSIGKGKFSLELDGKTEHYWGLANNSFINVVNGSILEADLTASEEASWTFGDQLLNVKKGTRIIFKDGKVEVFGEEGDSFELEDLLLNLTADIVFRKDSEVSLTGNVLEGKNFNVGGVRINEGSLFIANEGYVLGRKSLAEWDGLTIENEENLFLATSFYATKAHDNWLFSEEHRLIGGGEGFEILFNEDNQWAKIDPNDNFQIKAGKGFEFSLENRDINKKIPLMKTKGEFMINQNYKTIYLENGKVLATRKGQEILFNQNTMNKDSSTSPIELVVEGQSNKFLISNFKGISSVPLEATEGQTDERYSHSIYWKRASVENRYNYPTVEDFEKLIGAEINFIGLENNPEVIRMMIDVYESNPKAFKDLNGVKLYSLEEFKKNYPLKFGGVGYGGWIMETRELIAVSSQKNNGLTFDLLVHELGHNQHLAKRVLPGYLEIKKQIKELEKEIDVGEDWIKVLEKRSVEGINLADEIEKQKENKNQLLFLKDRKLSLDREIFKLDEDWSNLLQPGEELDNLVIGKRGDYQKRQSPDPFIQWKETKEMQEILSKLKEEEKGRLSFTGNSPLPIYPRYGFIRPYGASNIEEDVATFVETARSDPSFFRGYRLLDENSPFYNPLYKQKINILKKYGLITDQEYDSVFNPEKYGLNRRLFK
jgi:hypothetical protein